MVTQEALNKGIDQYRSERTETDINLILELRQMLVSAGLLMKVIEAYDSDRFIIEGMDKPPEVQRFLLNRYWSQQLMKSTKSSIEERSCLLNNGTYDDWLFFFKEKILPFILENNLPTNYYG